jgi:hypothetical protein
LVIFLDSRSGSYCWGYRWGFDFEGYLSIK